MSFELWLFVQCSQLLSNCCLLAFSHTAADRDTWLSSSTQANWLKNVWTKKINSHQYPLKLNKIFYTSFTLHKYNVGHDQGIVNQWNNPRCQFSDRFLYNVQWTGLHAAWCSAVVAAVTMQCSGGCSDIRPDDGSWYNPPRSGDHKQQHTDNPKRSAKEEIVNETLEGRPCS